MAIRSASTASAASGGRCVRAAKEAGIADLDFVAVNDLTDTKTLAHLFKYDSVHRDLSTATVAHAEDGRSSSTATRSRCFAEKDPAKLPWKDLGVDIVLESTGRFTERREARKAHRPAARRRSIISAPAKGEDITIVHGRQRQEVRPREAPHHLERVVHDELPRADGEGRARQLRLPSRLDGHDPQLHERPEHPRPAAQGPAARARRGAVDHPDDDRRREGDVAGDSRGEGKDRRHRDPRPDPRRVVHRSRGRSREAGRRSPRSMRRSARPPRATAEGDSRSTPRRSSSRPTTSATRTRASSTRRARTSSTARW